MLASTLYPCSLHTPTLCIPYSGYLSHVKSFVNCLKIDFCGENIRRFTVTQFTTPINMALEGQCKVPPLRGSAMLDRSSTLLASEFGRMELIAKENIYRWEQLAGVRCDIPVYRVWSRFQVDFCKWNHHKLSQRCKICESFTRTRKALYSDRVPVSTKTVRISKFTSTQIQAYILPMKLMYNADIQYSQTSQVNLVSHYCSYSTFSRWQLATVSE